MSLPLPLGDALKRQKRRLIEKMDPFDAADRLLHSMLPVLILIPAIHIHTCLLLVHESDSGISYLLFFLMLMLAYFNMN